MKLKSVGDYTLCSEGAARLQQSMWSEKYLLPLAPSQGTALVGKKLISLEHVGNFCKTVCPCIK